MDEERQEGRSDPASRLHIIHLASRSGYLNMADNQRAGIRELERGVQERVPCLREFETAA